MSDTGRNPGAHGVAHALPGDGSEGEHERWHELVSQIGA